MTEIKIFSDFACPFCYIGFSIMKRLKAERDDIDFLFIPSILNPNESLMGSSLYAHVDRETAHLGYLRIESLAKEYGLVYNNRERRFNTNRLHMASIYAYEHDKFFEFAQLGFEYIFEHGKNVALEEVVNEIGEKVGLDIKDMNAQINSKEYISYLDDAHELAIKYDIESIPTFIVDDVKKPTTLKPYKDFIKDLLG